MIQIYYKYKPDFSPFFYLPYKEKKRFSLSLVLYAKYKKTTTLQRKNKKKSNRLSIFIAHYSPTRLDAHMKPNIYHDEHYIYCSETRKTHIRTCI